MKLESKFDYGQKVKHIFNGFTGTITGVIFRGSGIQYEVLPESDKPNDWKESKWINEIRLEPYVPKDTIGIKEG